MGHDAKCRLLQQQYSVYIMQRNMDNISVLLTALNCISKKIIILPHLDISWHLHQLAGQI